MEDFELKSEDDTQQVECIYFAYVFGARVPVPFSTMKEVDDFMKTSFPDDYKVKMFKEVTDD